MRVKTSKVIAVILFSFLSILGCSKPQPMSSWERHCVACHDGETVLNGTVLMNREGMRTKYKNLEEFVNACEGSGACMNILKHQKKLLTEVGKELGISNSSRK
jgi:ABC-type bacteriocin/lantibiotic exporter with double-glycine peptidase domain